VTANRDDPNKHSELKDAALLESLRTALDPEPLADGSNERLIRAALSATARLPSGPLDDGLTDGTAFTRENDADMVEAILAAHSPGAVDPSVVESLIGKALGRERRSVVVALRVWTGVALGLAAAASVALALGLGTGSPHEISPTDPEQLARSRSLAPLFAETYAEATPTDRIDRIYAIRSRELRHNRYATWRVR
jgi:hypothetical protein